MKPGQQGEIRIIPIPFAGEVRTGDDIATLLLSSIRRARKKLRAGDIVVVKHKIISKAEGRLADLEEIQPSAATVRWAKKYSLDARVTELAMREAATIIRKKNGVLITETRHGFICANSGVDVSNVDGGRKALLLPQDPDRSAAELHRALKRRSGLAVPVIITDSFGRPWREGLCEFAIGVAGMKALRDDRAQRDPHGYELRVSEEAVADEIACAAGLTCGKLNRIPAAIVRGFRFEAASGSARTLLRAKARDLFR